MQVENMTLTIIIEEYYNLICEMNYLLILLNWVLEDNESIQFVKEKNIDHNGYQTMSLNADKGTGYYYTNGKKTAITWSRNEKANKMEYYDTEGNLLFVNPGKTYIAVYPKDRSNLIK